MQDLPALLGITATLTLGVISPGPSFLMVARTALSRSRREGVAAALGMGLGGVAFAALALFGLQALLAAVPSLYLALKVAGGAYLLWLGLGIWRSARQPLTTTEPAGQGRGALGRALGLGLLTQVSNPKTAVVYAGVFAAFLPTHPSSAFDAALLGSVLVIETGWYALVACLLSSERPRNTYLRGKARIDHLAGGLLMLLGLRLIATARHA